MRISNTKALGLSIAALVAMALLLVAPLSSLASARVEARAGDVVAIAGGDDCDVGTNSTDENNSNNGNDGNNGNNGNSGVDGNNNSNNGNEADDINDGVSGTEDNATTTQYEGQDNVDPSQDQTQNNDTGGAQDGGGGGAVARAGDAVAVAGGNCEATTTEVTEENVQEVTENIDGNIQIGGNNSEDVVVEDDGEIEDSTGVQDGNTVNTSNLETLSIEGESSRKSSTDETAGRSSANQTAAREKGFGFGGAFGERKESEPQQARGEESRSASGADWPLLRRNELDKLGKTRRFDVEPDATMTLSIRNLKLYDVPVIDSNTRKGLGRGVVHAPDTAYPWDAADQKNVFLTGHRLGSPEKDSRLIFYSLDELKRGDEIVLKDNKGQSYKYRVRELFKVGPDDAWVADTLVDRDLLTLQTYTLPDSKERLVVRADRVKPRSDRQEERGR